MANMRQNRTLRAIIVVTILLGLVAMFFAPMMLSGAQAATPEAGNIIASRAGAVGQNEEDVQNQETQPPVTNGINQDAVIPQFNPGLIISDQVFYNPATMDAGAINNFIAARNPGCVPGSDGTPCLKDYRENTVTRAADAYCGQYVGVANETPGEIIAKVSAACQVNPQVILVMLQKEQGLLTASAEKLIPRRYQAAMGYGCPDTAACDTQYYGFFNQVYNAARRFQIYKAMPTRFNQQVNRVNQIKYHPNEACGRMPVFIRSQATAGLYNYTPYVPNQAAIAAGGGLGDTCSSYGNRNFWRYFNTWFGDPTVGAPGVVTEAKPGRVSGADRLGTAAGISARAFAGGSRTMYLARQDVLVDALAAGALSDGPVLLVPTAGTLPQVVATEIARLRPSEIIALGGTSAVSDDMLAQAAVAAGSVAGAVTTGRVAGTDRVTTAIAIAKRAFPKGANTVYVANGMGADGQGSPDAVAGGSLQAGPVLLLDFSPAGMAAVQAAITALNAGRVVALGGPGAVSDEALAQVAGKLSTARLQGADRYGTAAAIGAEALRTGTPARSFYLARGDIFADAVAAGSLQDGPVLLVASCAGLTTEVTELLKAQRPAEVVALGGESAVCTATVTSAVNAANGK